MIRSIVPALRQGWGSFSHGHECQGRSAVGWSILRAAPDGQHGDELRAELARMRWRWVERACMH